MGSWTSLLIGASGHWFHRDVKTSIDYIKNNGFEFFINAIRMEQGEKTNYKLVGLRFSMELNRTKRVHYKHRYVQKWLNRGIVVRININDRPVTKWLGLHEYRNPTVAEVATGGSPHLSYVDYATWTSFFNNELYNQEKGSKGELHFAFKDNKELFRKLPFNFVTHGKLDITGENWIYGFKPKMRTFTLKRIKIPDWSKIWE